MKKLTHPLWTHLPALAALIVLVIYIFSGPLPGNVPVHFNSQGIPDRYGSPWSFLGMTLVMSVFYIALSIFLDELWARQETKKTFNWLSILDEIVVGGMTGIAVGHLEFIRGNGAFFIFPWQYVAVFLGATIVPAILLEMARPFRSRPEIRNPEIKSGDRSFKVEISRRLKDTGNFVYWDCQNPLWLSLVTTVLPLIMIACAVFAWFDEAWVAILLLLIAIIMIIPYGGQRVMVTRKDIRVRWGILGLPVFSMKTSDIAAVEKHRFAPLRDFGGYGIRFNREMRAYFLRGNEGVKITTGNGKKYLLGSDNSERLREVIQIVTER